MLSILKQIKMRKIEQTNYKKINKNKRMHEIKKQTKTATV